MNKRLRNKHNKKHAPLISVSKVGLTFNRIDERPEEGVRSYKFLATNVSSLAKKMRNWIADRGYVTNTKLSFPCHSEVHERTLFLDTVLRDSSRPIWFVGDLHGDLLALKTLTDFALSQDKLDNIDAPTRLFFLGDFADDAPFSAEVVAWIMQHCGTGVQTMQGGQNVKKHAAFEVMAVAGNHDDGLRFIEDDAGGKFLSTVSPSSFAEDLNKRIKGVNGDAWKAFGLAAIDFFKTLPRMVMWNKSVMVAHGGVPHSDVPISKLEDLNTTQSLSDFVWNRLHESAPKKFPNRESRGSQLGIKDFDGFISKLVDAAIVDFSPKMFIRGHDHHDGNFKRYENYKGCSVVTLNAFTVNRGSYGQKYRDLALLRWSPTDNNRMTLFRLKFPDGALEGIWRMLMQEQRDINKAYER